MEWCPANGGDAEMNQREQILGGHQTPSPIGGSHGRNVRTKFSAVADGHKGNLQLAQGFNITELLAVRQQEDAFRASLGKVGLPILYKPFLIVHREQRKPPPGAIQALVNPMNHFQVVLTIKLTRDN